MQNVRAFHFPRQFLSQTRRPPLSRQWISQNRSADPPPHTKLIQWGVMAPSWMTRGSPNEHWDQHRPGGRGRGVVQKSGGLTQGRDRPSACREVDCASVGDAIGVPNLRFLVLCYYSLLASSCCVAASQGHFMRRWRRSTTAEDRSFRRVLPRLHAADYL